MQKALRQKPFVAANCACINPNLIESELFGYKKGAFSVASSSGKKGIVQLADQGTLFLDEISEIPMDLQGKLLIFIQEKARDDAPGGCRPFCAHRYRF